MQLNARANECRLSLVIRYVAVIDLGKTNSKVALVDTRLCTEINVVKQAATTKQTALYPCLDHEAIESFIVESLKSLAGAHTIDAITVTTHGATVALIDEAGELALPVLDYEFTDIDELRDRYNERKPSFSSTGSPALPAGLNVGAQLFWQQTNYRKYFDKISTVLTWPQYWVFRLTGERINDLTSLGCHTDLYEPGNQCYSTLVNKMQWHDLMPPTTPSGVFAGSLSPEFSNRLRLSTELPIYTGIHDSNASLVPHLVTQSAPFSVVSTGTWFIAMAIGGHPVDLDESRDTLLNINARGDSVPSARFMGGRERDLLQVSEPATESDIENYFNNSGAQTFLLPSHIAGTGPYPQAEQQWIGEPDNETSASRTCTVTLYLALMAHECLLLVGADGTTFIEGPLAADSLFLQMLAAVSQRDVAFSHTETGTSVGAAMLITPPLKPLEYTRVTITDKRRKQLESYAASWKKQLQNHAK